jgi:hypothetical protein
MATQHTYTGHAYPPSEPLTATPVKGRVGILERSRAYRAERERERRVIVQWLRRTANRAPDPGPIRRRREALLHYRAAAVRTDLLEIAAALERTHDPDPAIVATLHELLANGCDSTLYNPSIHASELHATLHGVRSRLVTHA